MDSLHMLAGIREGRSILKAKPERVESIAVKRLGFIAKEAYRKVPFYSRIFRSMGLTGDDIKNVDDLSRLPILTRTHVLENQTQMLNDDFRESDCFQKTTSGTTGEPVVCLFDPSAWYHLEGIALRGQFQGGLKVKHKVAVVVTPDDIARNVFYSVLSRFGRLRYASVLEDVTLTLRSLLSFRPNILKAYPSFLKAAIETNVGLRCPLLFSMSEFLDEGLRNDVTTAFDARIIDLYGAVEFTSIAWECRVSSLYHLDADAVILETLKLDSDSPANPGEPARVLVTGLFNRAMPMIRYELGDIVVMSDEECSCGVKLPVIKRIEGRRIDCIRLPSGRLISPYMITRWVRELFGIKQYRIVQEERDKISVKVVPRPGFDEKLMTEWMNRLSRIVGENIRVEAELASSISVEGGGKYKYVISKVN